MPELFTVTSIVARIEAKLDKLRKEAFQVKLNHEDYCRVFGEHKALSDEVNYWKGEGRRLLEDDNDDDSDGGQTAHR